MRFGGFVCMASLLERNKVFPRPTAPFQGYLPQRTAMSPTRKVKSRNDWLVLRAVTWQHVSLFLHLIQSGMVNITLVSSPEKH